ncbi:MAG: tetratricopeptide repeat protein [Phycisphaerae bacterium]
MSKKYLLIAYGILVFALSPFAAERAAAQGSGSTVDAAGKQLLAAGGLMRVGRYKDAASEYLKFLDKYPKHEEVTSAQYGLAVCRYRLGEYDKAASRLQQVLKDGDFNLADEARAVLGHCLMQQKDYDAAVKAFDTLIEKHPKSKHAGSARLSKAQALYLQGKMSEAEKACKQLLQADGKSPHAPTAWYLLGITQYRQSEYDDAAKSLQKVLETPNSPYEVNARMVLGQCLIEQGSYKPAAEQFEKLVQLAPPARLAEARYNLGAAQIKLGKHDEAIKHLSAAIGKEGKSSVAAPARLQLGIAQMLSGKIDDARKTLSKVAREDKKRRLNARYYLARCDMAGKKYGEAQKTLDELAGHNPAPENLRSVMFDRAVCSLKLRDFDAAATHFGQFAQKFPTSPRADEATYQQAFCLHKAGQFAQSKAVCEKLIGDENNAFAGDARELNAENLFLLKEYKPSLETYRKLAESAKDNKDLKRTALLRAGQCRLLTNQDKQAVETLEKLLGDKDLDAAKKTPEALFFLGTARFSVGSYDTSASALDAYLKTDHKQYTDEAAARQAIALLRAGKTDDASKLFASLLKLDATPWVQRALLEYAQMLTAKGKPEPATQPLDKILSADPEADIAAPARYLRAWCEMDREDFADAADRFATFLNKHPKHKRAADAMFYRGLCLFRAGQTKDAENVLQSFAKQFEKSARAARAQHLRAQCLTKMDKHEDARKLLANLAGDDGTAKPEILYDLAWAQRETGKKDEAKKTYATLIKKFPDSDAAVPAAAELGGLLYKAEKYEEARDLLKKVVGNEKASADVRAVSAYHLGNSLLKLNKPTEAAPVFVAMAEKFPKHEVTNSALMLAGKCFGMTGKHDLAVRQFRKLLDRKPTEEQTVVAMLELGKSYNGKGDYKEAHKVYSDFLKKYPKSKFANQARYGAGWALQNMGKYDDARKLYEYLVEHDDSPIGAQAQFQTGECYMAEKRYEKAIPEFLKVDIVFPYKEWSAKALYEAGMCAEALNKTAEAKEHYASCVKQYPKQKVTELAKKRLEALQ